MISLQMSTREKYYVSFAVVTVVAFVMYQFVISPLVDSRKKKHRMVTVKAGEVEKMRALKSEYQELMNRSNAVKQFAGGKEKGFTLFSFLEKLAGTTGIKENISYMKPSTTVQKDTQVKLSLVEMKLQAITTEKLMTFLHKVETSRNMIFVRGISITKTGKDKKMLNAVLQLETVNQ